MSFLWKICQEEKNFYFFLTDHCFFCEKTNILELIVFVCLLFSFHKIFVVGERCCVNKE
jgi:hypothetical protein